MITEINSTTAALPGSQTQRSATGASPVAEEKNAIRENNIALKELEAKVSDINAMVRNTQRSIHFSVAEKTGDTIIQVFNAETDELIREIPSQELQKVAEAIEAQISEGLLFNASI